MTYLIKMLRNRTGATAIEYAFLAALIATAAIVAMGTLGSNLNSQYNAVDNVLTNSGATGR